MDIQGGELYCRGLKSAALILFHIGKKTKQQGPCDHNP